MSKSWVRSGHKLLLLSNNLFLKPQPLAEKKNKFSPMESHCTYKQNIRRLHAVDGQHEEAQRCFVRFFFVLYCFSGHYFFIFCVYIMASNFMSLWVLFILLCVCVHFLWFFYCLVHLCLEYIFSREKENRMYRMEIDNLGEKMGG